MTDSSTCILPANATPFEQVVDRAIDLRWSGLDAAVISRAKSAWDCPADLLNFLAFELSVDVWDDAWPDLKKRSVIARSLGDHRLKGTEAGLRRFVEIADAEVVQIVTPPQGFFASADLTKVQWDDLIAKHPKVRISLARGRGQYSRPNGIFAGASFAGDAAMAFDDGRALLGRRAWLVREDVSTPLQLYSVSQSQEDRDAVVIQRVVVPGKNANAAFADAGFVGDAFADPQDKSPAYYTFTLSANYVHSESRLSLTTVPVGYAPRDTRFYRESEAGHRDFAFFEGDLAGSFFAAADRADELIADVLYLHDPAVAVPQVAGMSFANHARVDMPHHTAEALIDWKHRSHPGSAFVADSSFVGRDPVGEPDLTRRNYLLNTVARSSRASDRVRVTFQTRRDRTLGDGMLLDGASALGTSIPNHL